MAIKTTCSCGFSFAARDGLAGRQVKCPRCTKPVTIPAPGATAAPVPARAAARPGYNKQLLDLLDEAGVKSAPTGPICQACGAEMHPSSVICVECGFNTATGEILETEVGDFEEVKAVGVTDAEKLLAKAEQEIDESPITSDEQDFGDGADSYIIAIGALAIMAVFVVLGLAVVLIMESVTSEVNPALISGIIAEGLALITLVWIAVFAFRTGVGFGIACLLIPFFAIYFGLSRGGKTLFVPTVVHLLSIVIAIACNLVLMNTG